MASSPPNTKRLLSGVTDLINDIDRLKKENEFLSKRNEYLSETNIDILERFDSTSQETYKIGKFGYYSVFIVLIYSAIVITMGGLQINNKNTIINDLNSQIKNLTIFNNKTIENNNDLAILQEKYLALEEKYSIVNNNLARKSTPFAMAISVAINSCIFTLFFVYIFIHIFHNSARAR